MRDTFVGLICVITFAGMFIMGFSEGGKQVARGLCTLLATERGDTLAIATEVPECREHLMDLYMDAREATP